MDFKAVAQQLRKPEGDFGKQVGLKMNESNLFMNRLAIEALDLKSKEHILEIGMGNGAFVKDIFLKEPSVHYTGCDYSETMVEEARLLNRNLVAKGQVQFEVAASDQLPFPAAYFDTVFTVNTIYFWTNPEKELREIARVLKKNGKLIIAIRPGSTMETMPFVQYGFTLYEKEGVEQLLRKNGFDVVKSIKKAEPDQEINGITQRLEALIIVFKKIGLA